MSNCTGQMSIFDFIPENETRYMLDVRGLCDDAYCPKCNYEFDELKELDCNRCPSCGVLVDWSFWHRCNDND